MTRRDLHAPDWEQIAVPCPKCREQFFLAQYVGVNLYGCGSCGSAWLDSDGCRRLIAAVLPDAVIETARTMDAMEKTDVKEAGYRVAARGHGAPRMCPWCATELGANVIAGIELDTCAQHGTFFDKRELVALSQVMSRIALQAPFLTALERIALAKTPGGWLTP